MATKKTRIKHAPEFKAEALKLAEKAGVTAAARQLSLYESQVYVWRKAVQYEQIISLIIHVDCWLTVRIVRS